MGQAGKASAGIKITVGQMAAQLSIHSLQEAAGPLVLTLMGTSFLME
jgi:hypothetical protein